ncbi:hypothetical protein VaNZ11_014151 [Volvox africanus]|uniref:Uncharacterized protein n=1 Tax=Volvox africanus TaxID=51714 RepID=A0ABQ5SJ04_9CHLO|nr:hypothetical protein VaNZ11_014151 [Volvox africanus]
MKGLLHVLTVWALIGWPAYTQGGPENRGFTHKFIQSSNRGTNDMPLPVWHEQFSIQFNETTRIFVTKRTAGTWYYDALSAKEAIYRENGNGDRYCGSVHPFRQTPCLHVVTDGKRYLVFPELGECCMCCTAEMGCGVLSPTWLQGASFEGTTTIQGVTANKWRRDGLQPNYWYATADEAQVPLELDQMPNDFQTFWPKTFTKGPPGEQVFQLPNGCSPRCPLTSVCTFASTEAQEERQLRNVDGSAVA